jgi:hypothetical protein
VRDVCVARLGEWLCKRCVRGYRLGEWLSKGLELPNKEDWCYVRGRCVAKKGDGIAKLLSILKGRYRTSTVLEVAVCAVCIEMCREMGSLPGR